MFNLDALDTLIAIVIVLLILSLLVQSIQSLLKKLLKLKSRQIEKSLLILFENIIEKHEPAPAPGGAAATTPAGAAAAAAPATALSAPDLVGKVLEEFKNVGRSTKFKNPVLESISKEDLLKILARVESQTFHSRYVEKFEELYKQVADLEQRIDSLATGDLLRGAASAKFAEMREVLSPLINDFKVIVSGGAVKRDVLLGDLLALREIKLDDALALLSSAQEAVARDLEAERAAKNDLTVAALQKLSDALTGIAKVIGQLGQRADEAFGVLRAQLDHIGNWYDTVMQSFEERYNRHMKNVSIYISIGVVIFFNVNIFRIYRSLSTDELTRSAIVKAGEKLIDQQSGAANTNAAPAATPTPSTGAAGGAAGSAPTQTPSELIAELKQDLKVIKGYAAEYQGFGFSSLTWGDIKSWLGTLSFNTPGGWLRARLTDLKTLVGWAFTVLLLSVGAPFWQDTLESLFGVKNLLRKKSDTRNVEGRSGEGQTRS